LNLKQTNFTIVYSQEKVVLLICYLTFYKLIKNKKIIILNT